MEESKTVLGEDQARLTKHIKIAKEFPPLYTGGSFYVLKDDRHCFALKDQKISVFDLETSKLLSTISQENEEILCFAISPNQEYLAVSNKSYMIRVFALSNEVDDYKSVEQVKQFKTPGQMVLELSFDPTSKFLAAGTADSQIKVFDVSKGFQTHNFIGHRGIITNLLFFPENDTLRLISTAEDGLIKVWDLVLRQEIASLKGHQALITSIIFTQDKSTLISSSKDGKIGFWNIKDHFKVLSLFKFSESEDELNALYYFTQDNNPYVMVGGASGTISIFDINNKRICFCQSNNESKNEITKIIHLQKSKRIMVLNSDQQMTIYSIKGSKKTNQVKLVEQQQNCFYLDEIIDVKIIDKQSEEEPTKALICSNNELLKVVDLKNGQIQQSAGHTDIILCLDVCRNMFLSGSKDNQIRLWKYEPEQHQVLRCLAVFSGHNENVASVSFAQRKMNFFVSASQDNTLKVWDIQKFKQPESEELQEVTSANLTVMAHQKYINVVKVSPNDKMIASSSQDKSIKIWNSNDLLLTQTLNGHKKGVWDIAFSPVDKVLISASGDKTIKVWNLNNGSCIATLSGHQTSLVKLQWLNAGLQILSASVDGVVKIWNVKKQSCVNTFQMHDEKIWGLDISSNDRYMVTGGGDSSLKLWQDCTVEKELEDKEQQLQKLKDEQKLSNLIRDKDFMEAALLAFRLNRLRDFYLVLNKLINFQPMQDPVDSVLSDRQKFATFVNTLNPTSNHSSDSQMQLSKILNALMKEDKKKLFTIIRNLNSKNDYSNLAHHLMSVILAKFKVEDYSESQTDFKELKETMETVLFYSEKHLDRAERGLKKSFYPDYIVSQMSIEAEKDFIKEAEQQDQDADMATEKKENWKEAKLKKKELKKTQMKLLKKKKRSYSDNLFEDNEDAKIKQQHLAKRVKK